MLERMRSMGAERKDELKQEFVGFPAFTILGALELAAHLAEFTRPIGEKHGAAGVLNQGADSRRHAGGGGLGERIRGLTEAALGAVESAAEEPAAAKLVVAGNVIAKGRCGGRSHIGLTRPNELAAADEGTVDGAAERLPAHGGIDAVKLIFGVEQRAVAAREGTAERAVGGFGDVAIGAQVLDGG